MNDKTAAPEISADPIALHEVKSSQIAAIGYNPSTQTLAIQFKSRARPVYHYANVTPELFGKFEKAPSAGNFFYTYIKPNAEDFPYVKVSEEAESVPATTSE